MKAVLYLDDTVNIILLMNTIDIFFVLTLSFSLVVALYYHPLNITRLEQLPPNAREANGDATSLWEKLLIYNIQNTILLKWIKISTKL